MKNYVSSEIGTIRKILIHSPDGGIGKIIPSKFRDWLYDDTVHLRKMQEEYDDYIMLLLYFMDKEKADYVRESDNKKRSNKKGDVFKPDKPDYFNSDKVLDVQKALSDILEDNLVRIRLVSAVCALEGCSHAIQIQLESLDSIQLSKSLITGVVKKGKEERFIFPPVPNLVFTRDIGVMVKDHLLLSKSATQARKRESLIAKYIALFHPQLFAQAPKRIIEITEDSSFFLEDLQDQEKNIITIEGGDIMMISPNHLIVGCSERTSQSAVDAIIHQIFSIKALDIEKISVVQIPAVRAQMHIDTIFTQIKDSAWVLYGGYSEEVEMQRLSHKQDYTSFLKDHVHPLMEEKVRVIQFYKQKYQPYEPSKNYFYEELKGIEELLTNISIEDFGVPKSEVRIIYSGNQKFPYSAREQWTDSCNLLALKNGLVIGYDRNEQTIEAFKDPVNGLGFKVIHAKDLLPALHSGEVDIHDLEDTLILLSSSELSRARGGSHCMSMPLIRDKFARR
ncbi:MAG: hypothetical protein KDC44_20375 [Phaeodactylibacter sp.]|nr:hypothetical protein [Phaeodactylibacter sp.]